MSKKVQKNTLCWSCKNAVPKIANGKYICGCSWSMHLKPVEGWTAEKSVKNENSGNRVETWYVKDCPEYEKDRKNDAEFQNSILSDEGYIRLAACVIRAKRIDYVSALRSKKLSRIRTIERDLRSPFYYAITMGKVDFEAYIAEMRRKFGFPPDAELEKSKGDA